MIRVTMFGPSTLSIGLFAVVGGAPAPEAAVEPAPERVCAPGQQIACACMGGGQGVQRCLPDGGGYGDCQCAEPAAASDPAGTPSSPPESGPEPTGTAAPAPAEPASEGPAPAPASQPVEPPVDRNRGKRVTMIIAGASTLGAGYIIGALGGAAIGITNAATKAADGTDCGGGWGWSFLPIAGPAITAATWPDYYKIYPTGKIAECARFTTTVRAVSAISVIAQVAGVSMLITGAALPKKPAETASRSRRARWSVTPQAGPGYAGLHLRVWEF